MGITDEKYKQPLLFGSNKLQGQVRVVPGSRIHGDVGSFSFTFKKGDSAEFYRDFLGALGSARFGEQEPLPPPLGSLCSASAIPHLAICWRYQRRILFSVVNTVCLPWW